MTDAATSARASLEAADFNLFGAARRRRDPDRPLDRQRHRRDEQRAVGRRSCAATSRTPARRACSASSARCARSSGSSTSSPRTRGARPSTSSSRHSARPGESSRTTRHFDTTRANVEAAGGDARSTCPAPRRADPRVDFPFKGNVDLAALERCLDERRAARSPLVMVTITNNAGGGQPVEPREPARRARALCARHGVPLYPRRLPLRRERVPHPAARARPRGPLGARGSRARCSRSPTAAR